MEAALETIRLKTLNSNRLAAYFILAGGFIFGCFGIYEITRAPSTGDWVMAAFISGLAVVFFIAGTAVLRMLKSKG
jgi:hypothetical protein